MVILGCGPGLLRAILMMIEKLGKSACSGENNKVVLIEMMMMM
jgi:hypothetical protein